MTLNKNPQDLKILRVYFQLLICSHFMDFPVWSKRF